MLRSSLGFHTISLSTIIRKNDISRLITDFKKYSKESGNLQIYSDKNSNIVIKFFPRDKGIKWTIYNNVWIPDRGNFMAVVSVEINPKILGGMIDYITAADCGDMNVAIVNFNSISKSISSILGRFEYYRIKRIDYCINFSLDEPMSFS